MDTTSSAWPLSRFDPASISVLARNLASNDFGSSDLNQGSAGRHGQSWMGFCFVEKSSRNSAHEILQEASRLKELRIKRHVKPSSDGTSIITCKVESAWMNDRGSRHGRQTSVFVSARFRSWPVKQPQFNPHHHAQGVGTCR
jgi:hypothetical protein